MVSYDLFGYLDQGLRLFVVLIEALCAVAILVRFRFKPVAYLAALSFLGYAFLDFVYVVLGLVQWWGYEWFHAIDLFLKAMILFATLLMAVGLTILGLSAAKGGANR